MHILYINKVSPHLGGGAENRIWEVGKRLVGLGHKVTVVCGKTTEGLPNKDTLDGLELVYVNTLPEWFFRLFPEFCFTLSRVAFFLRCRSILLDVLRKENVDIIRDDIAPFPNFFAIQLANWLNIPIVGTVHNLSGTLKKWISHYGLLIGSGGYLAEKWIRKFRPYCFIISDSKWMAEALQNDLLSDAIKWIPNGVNIEKFYPAGSRTLKNKLCLFYAGRFVELKGHQTLIKAFDCALKSTEDIELHLAGDGPLLEQIQSQVREVGLQNVIIFHGRVEKKFMVNLYQQMDVYISPSLFEGMPVTFLEAMACGLPIITTRIEALDGVLSETNSIVVEPNSSEELTKAILNISKDSGKRRQMSKWGIQEVSAKFTWEKTTATELLIYQKILSA